MTGEPTHSSSRKPADHRTPDTPAPDSPDQETPLPSLAQQIRLDPRLLTPAGILQLQRTVGNKTTAKFLSGRSNRINGVQRFKDEDIKLPALHEWEEAGGERNQSLETMQAFWDKGVKGLIAYYIWQYKKGGGNKNQPGEESKQDFEAAAEIWEFTQQKKLTVDWITESLIKWGFKQETIDDGKENIKEQITNLADIQQKAPPEAAKSVQDYLANNPYEPDTILKWTTATHTPSNQTGNLITINGVGFKLDRPSIITKNPSINPQSPNSTLPTSFASQGYTAIPGTSTEIANDGIFGILATIKIEPNNIPLTGWSIGIIQNLIGNREVKYEGELFDSLTYSWTFAKALDSRTPPWFKGKKSGLDSIKSNQPLTIYNSDSPYWFAPHKIKDMTTGTSLTFTIEANGFSINDQFSAYIVVQDNQGKYTPLFKQEWKFVSDGQTASYQIGNATMLDGRASAGLETNLQSVMAIDPKIS